MPPIVRVGDSCSGHGCFPPRETTSGSGNVFINSKGVHRKGDSLAVHCCGLPCHGGTTAEGSPSIFVNSQSVARIGDPVDCGSALAKGSGNTFANS